MAALGRIRSRGIILVTIIGLALLAFITEEFFRSLDYTRADQQQRVGEVLGKKIDYKEYQSLIDEYTEVLKMQQGKENLTEDELTQVKDMVWNNYVQNALIAHEAEELGLTVTDKELQNILTEGTNPMLMQTPFVNQQTGKFDVSALQKFLAEYKTQKSANPQLAQQYESVYKYWNFIEKSIRQQTLAQKYQSLLAQSFLSNPYEAKMAFKEENTESNIELASLPYSSIEDSKVQVSDAELKDKYNEIKTRFKQFVESRDIRYIDVQVLASNTDKNNWNKKFEEYKKSLSEASDPTDVLRRSASLVGYNGVPVSKTAFPSDIASRLDSMAVGTTSNVISNAQDNTLSVIKLISKQQLPDSVQFRAIQVVGTSPEDAAKRADSIYNAVKAGADFEVIAKKYGQTGQKQWMTTTQYQMAPTLDADTKNYLTKLNTMGVNELQNLKMTQGNLILQVVDRKAMITKYVAAVIKKVADFSDETYKTTTNKFKSFISANQKVGDLVKNASKNGYRVQEAKDVTTAQHYVAGIRGTKEAMKWIFDAKPGEVSTLYQCGDNDHLLLVILDRVNKEGYRSLDDPQVKDMVKAEVLKDKKAAMLVEKLKGVNSVAAAKVKGAQVTPVNQVTFASPVFVPSTGASEPALSGAVYATAKGTFAKKPVVGNAGVYVFQVTGKTERKVAYDEKAQEQKLVQRAMQYAGSFMNELYVKAGIVDHRYLF